jgi:AcrR family transcriptional regulator
MIARPRLLDGEDLRSGARQTRSRDKRARLNAAALALFAERGYEATSIEAIAQRAGVAIGTVYQHVRSKRQLLLALMDELLEHLSYVDVQPKPSAGRHQALRDLLAPALAPDRQRAAAYRAWQEAVLTDPDLARKDAAIHAWTTSRMRATLDFLHRLPRARHGLDLAALAIILDRLFWIVVREMGQASDIDRDRWIDAATQIVYHAVVQDAPRSPKTPRISASRAS